MNWLFRFFQRRCKHLPRYVLADVLEGDARFSMQWCLRCGAYRITHGRDIHGFWNSPDARQAEQWEKKRPF